MAKSWNGSAAWMLATSLLAAAPLHAQGANPAVAMPSFEVPKVEKPGDDALTCAQIVAETKQLDTEMAGIAKDTEKMAMGYQAGMMAKQGAGNIAKQAISGLAATLLPGVGGLVGAGIDAASSATKKKTNPTAGLMKDMQPMIEQQTYVAERKRHLEMLYMDKCSELATAPASGTK
jgi:hypothetical protein